MLEYHSIQSLVDAAQEKGCTISELVLADQSVQTETPKDELFRKMQDNLHVMQEAVQAGVDKDLKSTSGLTGGDAYKMQQYAQGGGLCGNFFTQALTRAIAVSEYNAAMGKIVAAPTAGSCGILPGTILSLMEDRDMPEETAVMALFTAGAFGMVIADRASIAGAQGGCQAECGSAAAMAAAAMVEMMRKMGIGSYLPEVPSLCVGSCDLSPYEIISAYNTFPSQGVYVEPMFVTRIEDSMGNVIGEFNSHKREAVSEQTAYLMANLMEGVVNSGSGIRLRLKYGLKGEMAGKTGTTNDHSDGWFIGYTPTLTGGVWVGAEDRQIHFETMRYGQGANMALPIWGIFMKKVLEDGTLGVTEDDRFIAPAGMHLNLDCDGSDNDARSTEQVTGDYFFE